ncbi:nuclear transport factor 2 family protein [Azospirillum picis]|uniref:Ketosteroid isomerase-like protein n=1 Tax=Azospirillum picis TaxID=488438 RepID=A0ABU0MS93_9PROT|nr:nuclear transport factor 2 family protein [Azospirillum picis]MBP2302664.1 ketosteroid isomerase-like protein [Azospirillum picis]MDQ0536325.1 ketosteroid isomerase-like protein [Azospirillum picis]
MTTRIAMALIGSLVLAAPHPASAQESTAMTPSRQEQNRAFVQAAFDRWAQGQGDVFALVADDVTWQIMGADPDVAKTHHSREALMAAAARPLAARLRTPLKPSVRKIWADGDDVLVHWDGSAELVNGTPYRNSYLWILTLQDQRIVAVTAFLDIPAFKAALALPAPVE